MRKWKRQNGKRCGSQAGTDAEVRRTELWRSGGQRCENWVNRDVDIGLSIQLTHPVSKRRRIQIVFSDKSWSVYFFCMLFLSQAHMQHSGTFITRFRNNQL